MSPEYSLFDSVRLLLSSVHTQPMVSRPTPTPHDSEHTNHCQNLGTMAPYSADTPQSHHHPISYNTSLFPSTLDATQRRHTNAPHVAATTLGDGWPATNCDSSSRVPQPPLLQRCHITRHPAHVWSNNGRDEGTSSSPIPPRSGNPLPVRPPAFDFWRPTTHLVNRARRLRFSDIGTPRGVAETRELHPRFHQAPMALQNQRPPTIRQWLRWDGYDRSPVHLHAACTHR